MKKLFYPFVLLFVVGITFTSCSSRRVLTTATTDSGVVIDGIRWATRNVDMPGTFAVTPESFGMFYQWNRNVGWSSINPVINTNGENTWDSSNHSGTYWYPVNCPCPPDWRVPMSSELASLNNSGSTWVTDWKGTGVSGRVFGTYPNLLFLPAAGFRISDGTLGNVGTSGLYWSSTQNISIDAWGLWFNSVNSLMSGSYRAGGQSVRCVSE